jgi:YebC/PmpR family DNA-binding regulatory protein
MSGHSKWSKVKHQKATTDAVKSREFTRVSRAITVAVKQGGGITDPDKNFRLRLAMDKAREVNMPKDTITRAIEKGSDTHSTLETIVYEGYGPGGVAVLVEAATDNRQRTAAVVKHAFDRSGGALATPGAVQYLFDRIGVLLVQKDQGFDLVLEAALEAGADDVIERDDVFEIFVSVNQLYSVRLALSKKGLLISQEEVVMKPKTSVQADSTLSEKIDQLIALLESADDVQSVYTNTV